jgi:hypothetical protein
MRRAIQPTRLLLAGFLALASCFPRVTVPEDDRRRATEALAGQRRFLKVAAFVGPFFGDRTKALLSDRPDTELDLLETPDGRPILRPPAEGVLPPGTRVAIHAIQFPTGVIIAGRPVMTPRYHPWVFLTVQGDDRPHVLVLSQTAASLEDVLADVDRVLTVDDPAPALQALAQAQREAVLKKDLAEGMARRVVAMAWGYPDKIVVDRPADTEEWSWTGGRRRALFQVERLVRWEPR